MAVKLACSNLKKLVMGIYESYNAFEELVDGDGVGCAEDCTVELGTYRLPPVKGS